MSKESKGFELPIGVGITGWVALYGEPFLCGNVLEEEKYFQIDDRIKSEMAAPLIEGGRTVGALNVDAVEENAFSESDLRLLVLMANEASRVLEYVDDTAVKKKLSSYKLWFLSGRIWVVSVK